MRQPMKQRRPERGGRTYLAVLAIVVAVLVGSFFAGFFKPARLGLDLQGGLEIVLKATPTDGKSLSNEDLTKSVDVIRDRVDGLGVVEPEIRTQGSDQIVVSLPGVQDPDEAVAVVGNTAQLRFYEFEQRVVNDKAYRTPYRLLQANQSRVKGAPDSDDPRQQYLFDTDQEVVAGPAPTRDDLIEVAAANIAGDPESSRPAGSDALEDGRLPKGWEVLEVPRGEVMVHGAPEQLAGIDLDEAGQFDRFAGVYLLFENDPGLEGSRIRTATAETNQGGWVVSIVFDGEGADQFERITRSIARDGQLEGENQRFAIVLDDEIVSAPTIDYQDLPNGISGGQAQISGLDDRDEASNLALVLNTGALPVRFDVISRTQVSATLGEESLRQGLLAGAAGLAIVMLYLILFYRALGLIADLALLAFALIFYAVVVLVPVTMTLPGIAGMILTIGVAADANIIIFERIREEYRAGRSIPMAIRAGYGKGFRTIIDASAVTLITALVLIVVTVGSVRGFAVLLGLGTLLSIFTAVAATYALLGLLGAARAFQHPWIIGGSRRGIRFRVPWMRYQKPFLVFAALMIIGSLAIIGIKGLNFGVDFRSGTRFDVGVEQRATPDQIRDVLRSVNPAYGNATIQETREAVSGEEAPEGRSFSMTVEDLSGGGEGGSSDTRAQRAQNDVRQALDERFGVRADDFNVQTIGPSFGRDVAINAGVAVLISLVLLVLYIWLRFELRYALPVLLALVHDMAVAAGAYALLGAEFKATTVAALLTILGYSLYDTIIVFDRVRENVQILRRSSFSRIVTTSLNEVLTRSLNTSVVVLLPVIALYLFGGATLQDFAFALMVGVFVGAYSSIVVASPLLAYVKERDPAWRRRADAERTRGDRNGAIDAAPTGENAEVPESDVDAPRPSPDAPSSRR